MYKVVMKMELPEGFVLIPGSNWHYINRNGVLLNLRTANYLGSSCRENDYPRFLISANGLNTNYAVHRLVAQLFVPNPHNKKYVNHKDGNRFNFCADNLEWCTLSENMRHAYDTGLIKQRGPNTGITQKLRDLKVLQSIVVPFVIRRPLNPYIKRLVADGYLFSFAKVVGTQTGIVTRLK